MGMSAVLCTLSPKRLALLQAEPEVLEDLLDSRHDSDIPGLLDLGKAWDALDRILSEGGKEPVMADAILARKGQKLRAPGAYGPPRVLAPARVRQISTALANLPAELIPSRYPSLQGQEVHGNYGQGHQEKELAELTQLLRAVVELYANAAREGHSMMSVIV
jgi:hypothetical protein